MRDQRYPPLRIRENPIPVGAVVGAALFAVSLCVGGLLHAATIATGLVELDTLQSDKQADNRIAGAATTGPRFADGLAISCAIGAQVAGALDDDCAGPSRDDDGRVVAAAILADGWNVDRSALMPGFSTSAIAFDGALLQASFDISWISSSGLAVARLDDSIKPSEGPRDADPWWFLTPWRVARSDLYVKDAVPALAAVALLVGGLLLYGLARRRRRTAWARRIKRSSARQRPPSSS